MAKRESRRMRKKMARMTEFTHTKNLQNRNLHRGGIRL